MNAKRKQRIAELIKVNASQIIHRDFAGNMPAMATIMRVDVSDDLKYAKIFISLYGEDRNRERSLALLQRGIKSLRKQLGGVLNLRQVPFLTIVEDYSLDNAFRIDELLHKIRRDDTTPEPSGSP